MSIWETFDFVLTAIFFVFKIILINYKYYFNK